MGLRYAILLFLLIISTELVVGQYFKTDIDSAISIDIKQLINKKGQYQVPKKLLVKQIFNQSFTKVEVKDTTSFHYGYVDRNGLFIIPPVYDSVIAGFKNGRVHVGKYFPGIEKNTLFVGILNEMNMVIVPVSFVEIGVIDQGFIPVKNHHNLWAIYDTTGRLLQEPAFDSIRYATKDGIWVRKQGKWALINRQGKYSIVPKYKHIQPDTGQYALATKFPVFDYMNVKSEAVLSFECDSVVTFTKGIYLYYQNENCGLRTIKDDSKAIYNYIGPLVNQRSVACKNNRWGLLNHQGKTIVPFLYDSIGIDQTEFIRLKHNGFWGMIDKIQFQKIPFKYLALNSFCNGMAAAQSAVSTLWGYVNIVGDTVIPFQYQNVEDFSAGLAVVSLSDSTFIINKKGSMVVSPSDMPRFTQGAGRVDNNLPVKYTFPIENYDSYKKFVDGITLVACGNRYGLLGKQGNELFPPICDTVVYDKELQVATFHCDTMAGVVDRFDNFVHPLLYNFDTIYAYHQGCALAKKKGYFGGIDIMKNIRVAPQYEKMQNFHDGKWGITLNGKWGFTDLNENIVVQPNYEAIQPFNGSAGGVKYKSRWNLISAQDKMMNITTYDSISPTPYGSWILYLDGKQGLTDTTGEEIIVCRYEQVQDLGKGLIQVWKNGKTEVMNRFQDFLIPMIYDKLEFDNINELFLLYTNGRNVLIK